MGGFQDVVTALQNLVTGLNALLTAVTDAFSDAVDPNGTN